MRADEYPKPVSDPEADGIPRVADDDSAAKDGVDTGREADGPNPATLPADEPMAVDSFGTTAEEQLHGESLDAKIARERLDPPVEEPLGTPADPRLADEATSEEAAAQAQFDSDVLNPGPTSDPSSQVSIYDNGSLDSSIGGTVGRLVESDEGLETDRETDSIAHDAGAAGGGATEEELAIHETEPPPLH
ncbi:DUF5709 domain-containing protein [Polymorphospora lycopeni]|uniref:DUF5709 domain-containing protein n=1 Tax=Polymorphospora lycopeni TaxID=3140240 RepID=A0ABV5CU53_9ACTN